MNTFNDLQKMVSNYNLQFNSEELPVNKLEFSDDVYNILSTIIDSQSHSYNDPFDAFEEYQEAMQEDDSVECEYEQSIIDTLETIDNNSCDSDYNLDFDGNEYRLISDSSIWDIYVEEIKNIVNDCYDLKLDDIPSFIAFEIDWEQTAKNAYVDGYGHTFSGYDGSEEEAGGFYIFRTN